MWREQILPSTKKALYFDPHFIALGRRCSRRRSPRLVTGRGERRPLLLRPTHTLRIMLKLAMIKRRRLSILEPPIITSRSTCVYASAPHPLPRTTITLTAYARARMHFKSERPSPTSSPDVIQYARPARRDPIAKTVRPASSVHMEHRDLSDPLNCTAAS